MYKDKSSSTSCGFIKFKDTAYFVFLLLQESVKRRNMFQHFVSPRCCFCRMTLSCLICCRAKSGTITEGTLESKLRSPPSNMTASLRTYCSHNEQASHCLEPCFFNWDWSRGLSKKRAQHSSCANSPAYLKRMEGQSWLSQRSDIKHAWCVLLFNWLWNINTAGIHWLTFDWRVRGREREKEKSTRERHTVEEVVVIRLVCHCIVSVSCMCIVLFVRVANYTQIGCRCWLAGANGEC